MFYPCELMSTDTPWAVDRWQGSAIHRCPPLILHIFAKTKHAKQTQNQAVGSKKKTGCTRDNKRNSPDKDKKNVFNPLKFPAQVLSCLALTLKESYFIYCIYVD